MENLKRLVKQFNKVYSDRHVTGVYNYSGGRYIFEAPKNGQEKDYEDPYWIVAKNGDIEEFSPMSNLDEFYSALKNPVNF